MTAGARRYWGALAIPLLQAACAKLILDDPKFDRPVVLVETDGGVSFVIDAKEVSVAQYAAWLTTKPVPNQAEPCSFNTSFEPGDFTPPAGETTNGCDAGFDWRADQTHPDYPVRCVDWCDADAYCKAKGERLCGRVGGGNVDVTYDKPNDAYHVAQPKTSEWYLACSHGDARTYPYGNTYEPSACNGASGLLVDVGSSPGCVGGYDGLFDMSGNVAEWEAACLEMPGATQAACIPRGGAYYSAQDDDPLNLACPYNFSAVPRSSMWPSTGFRCCADH